MAVSTSFGDFFKRRRRELGLTLREFCRVNGFDPGNLSKIERGILAPPQTTEKRLDYAKALGIEEGSDDWLDFCDLASMSAGKIPADIATDKNLLNALPVLFRTARRNDIDEDTLRKLIESIRQELK